MSRVHSILSPASFWPHPALGPRDRVLVCAYMCVCVCVFAYMDVGVHPLTYFSSVSCAGSFTSNPFFYLRFTLLFPGALVCFFVFRFTLEGSWLTVLFQGRSRAAQPHVCKRPLSPPPSLPHALSAVPCAVQWVLVGYPFYTWHCVRVRPQIPSCAFPPSFPTSNHKSVL